MCPVHGGAEEPSREYEQFRALPRVAITAGGGGGGVGDTQRGSASHQDSDIRVLSSPNSERLGTWLGG